MEDLGGEKPPKYAKMAAPADRSAPEGEPGYVMERYALRHALEC